MVCLWSKYHLCAYGVPVSASMSPVSSYVMWQCTERRLAVVIRKEETMVRILCCLRTIAVVLVMVSALLTHFYYDDFVGGWNRVVAMVRTPRSQFRS